jgi:agmatine deiminase
MPAEWEQKTGCWLGWPERADNFRQNRDADEAKKHNNLLPVQYAIAEVCTIIAESEAVTVCAQPHSFDQARAALPSSVRVVAMELDDSWFRDTACIFVRNDATNEVRGVCFAFNSWGGLNGGCYDSWAKDAKVSRKIADLCNVAKYESSVILEGGSFNVDGQGTLITTEQCLLHPNRSPDGKTPRTKAAMEQLLLDYLNVRKVIWIPGGIYTDEDTDGHVDNIAVFVAPAKVMLAWTDDINDPQYVVSSKAYEVLTNSTDAMGRKIEVVKLHIPSPMYYQDSDIKLLKGATESSVRAIVLACKYLV